MNWGVRFWTAVAWLATFGAVAALLTAFITRSDMTDSITAAMILFLLARVRLIEIAAESVARLTVTLGLLATKRDGE